MLQQQVGVTDLVGAALGDTVQRADQSYPAFAHAPALTPSESSIARLLQSLSDVVPVNKLFMPGATTLLTSQVSGWLKAVAPSNM